MLRKLVVVLLTGVMCLIGVTSALAVKYNEAPMLRTMVAAGELPPVEERLPEEPLIVEPIEEIGQYGGTFNTFALDMNPWNDLNGASMGSDFLLAIAEDGSIVPNLAKGYELSDDLKSFTLYLREGAKWSDGYPFTADDILFMFEDMHWNDQVSTWDLYPGVSRVKKIDDYTVRYEMDEPYPVVQVVMTSWPGGRWSSFAPKHYLKRWHIRYNPDADKLAKEEGFDNWWEAFQYHQWYAPTRDTNQPTMLPWAPKKFTSTVKVFERNPYYYQVDEEGNQLPYVDRIVSTVVDKEVYHMKAMTGEADIAALGTSIENYPLYKENEEEGGYRVMEIPGIVPSQIVFGVNQNHPDPFLRRIFQDVRFRQALSLAINREEINDTVYFGLGVPCQATTHPSSSYYKEEWAKVYAQHDPDRANRLLDEVGLTERDKDGFRVDPDGKPILLLVEYFDVWVAEVTLLELVKEYWEDVGLKVMLKGLSHGLFDERSTDVKHIIMALGYETTGEISFLIEPGRPGPNGVKECPAWGDWLNANDAVRRGTQKLEDYEDGKLPGEEPPEKIKEQWERVKNQAVRTRFGSKEYMELMEKIYDYQAEYLYAIGTIGMVPKLYIVKKDIVNVPKAFGPAAEWGGEIFYDAQQFFWKQ